MPVGGRRAATTTSTRRPRAPPDDPDCDERATPPAWNPGRCRGVEGTAGAPVLTHDRLRYCRRTGAVLLPGLLGSAPRTCRQARGPWHAIAALNADRVRVCVNGDFTSAGGCSWSVADPFGRGVCLVAPVMTASRREPASAYGGYRLPGADDSCSARLEGILTDVLDGSSGASPPVISAFASARRGLSRPDQPLAAPAPARRP
jgi:hypothetical protein